MARLRDGKPPVNGRLLCVALVFPGRDFACERGFVGDAASEALLLEHPPCDLGHMQPTAMLWRGMPRQSMATRRASAGSNASYSDAIFCVLR